MSNLIELTSPIIEKVYKVRQDTIPFLFKLFFVFFSTSSKMLTRSAKRKLQGEEEPQIKTKYKRVQNWNSDWN